MSPDLPCPKRELLPGCRLESQAAAASGHLIHTMNFSCASMRFLVYNHICKDHSENIGWSRDEPTTT